MMYLHISFWLKCQKLRCIDLHLQTDFQNKQWHALCMLKTGVDCVITLFDYGTRQVNIVNFQIRLLNTFFSSSSIVPQTKRKMAK